MQIPASEWLAAVSARLLQRWPSIKAARLDDVALDLWNDKRLRGMPPDQATDVWLAPVMSDEVRTSRLARAEEAAAVPAAASAS